MNSITHSLLSLRQLVLSLCPSVIWPRYIEYDGLQIPLRSIKASFGNKLLLLNRQYELPERILSSQFVTKGMTIVEIGSSLGILSAYLAKLTGITGQVVALEGSFSKFHVAKSWAEKYFPNLILDNNYGLPIWSTHHSISIDYVEDSISTLGGRPYFSRKTNDHGDKPSPLCLKDIVDKYQLGSIDALVVDIEGSEEELLHHDLNFPPQLSYILIELHPYKYSTNNTTEAIINKLQSLNFNLVHVIESSYLFSR